MDNINWGSSPPIADHNIEKFRQFQQQSPEQIKQACLDEKGRLKHIIRAEHFDLNFLKTICDTINAARRIAKLEDKFLKKLLTSKSVLNYFNQPSSRTFLSFSTAEAHLGMRREEVRDLGTSSTVKGETDRDALRTISSYFNAIVCRTSSDIYDLFALWVMKSSDREIPIINAGSGAKEHPTQGILDYYTKRESFNGQMENRIGIYVGDCLRGRTVHSDAKIMSLHPGATFYFVAPQHLQIDEETEKILQERNAVYYKITNASLKEVIKEVNPDYVYMTRVQNEHGGEGGYDPKLIFTREMLDDLKEGAILMHPLPKREEIDPKIDELKRDRRVMYWRQMRNGMWARVALLAYLFGVDDKIREHFGRIEKSVAPKPL